MNKNIFIVNFSFKRNIPNTDAIIGIKYVTSNKFTAPTLASNLKIIYIIIVLELSIPNRLSIALNNDARELVSVSCAYDINKKGII